MRTSLLRVLQPVVFVLLISGSGVGLPADTPLLLPAFPSARGFGCDTPGGRGGVTVEVTSLADSGPGSLREALSREQPRTVVFRVGGTIELARPLTVTAPFLTLAGQTAPGDGVCLKGAGLEIATHDVIIRHLRVRPGAPAAAGLPGEAIRIRGGHRVVLDHLSLSWGSGSTVRIGSGPDGPARDVTVQWSFIAETLRADPHAAPPFGAGLLVEEGAQNVTLHHNLFAHNDDGNPRLQGATKVDFLSNIVYDWGLVAAGVHLSRAVEMNLANSYFRRGPDSIGSFFLPLDARPVDPPSSIWIAANRGNDDNLYRYNSDPAPFQAAYPFLTGAPPFPASAAVDEADWAFELVLGRAGATVPKRDAVDMRLAGEARRRTGRLIDSPADVGGWPVYRPAPPPADADRDGLPDEWEAGCGLDPVDPADAAEDADGDGYTALEAFLNGKGGDR